MSFTQTVENLSSSGIEDKIDSSDFSDNGIPKAKVDGVAYTIPVTASSGDVTVTLTDDQSTPVTDAVTFKAGANITLTLGGSNSDEITIAGANFADVKVYDSTTNRNAASNVQWHTGDVAIVDDGTDVTSYYFSSADQSSAAATADSDWDTLHSPVDELTGAEIIGDINSAASGTINANRLDATVIVSGDNLSELNDVASYSSIAEDHILLRNSSGSWANKLAPFPTDAPTTPDSGTETYVVQINSSGDLTYVAESSSAVDVVSNVATNTILGRNDTGSGDSEELTPAEVRTMLNVADGATANSAGTGITITSGAIAVTNPFEAADETKLDAIPSIPANASEAKTYTLNVPTSGSATWSESVGVTVDVVSNVATDTILGRTSTGSGDSEELTAAQVRTLLNVEDDAAADQTGAEMITAINAETSGTINSARLDLAAPVEYIQDDAPTGTIEVGSLWFYTGGDENDGDETPRLFVRYEDEDDTAAWIAATPSPELPNAPAVDDDDDKEYVLKVATDDGAVTWEESTSAAASIDKESGIATVAAADFDGSSDEGQFAITRFGTVSGSSAPVKQLTKVETHHILTYNGLVLIEGLDYDVNYTSNLITLKSDAVDALEADAQLVLTNTIAA